MIVAAEREAEAARRFHETRLKEHADGAMGTLQGEVISATLDFLSKELVRLNEHHKIATIVRAAEIARRERCVVHAIAHICVFLVFCFAVSLLSVIDHRFLFFDSVTFFCLID